MFALAPTISEWMRVGSRVLLLGPRSTSTSRISRACPAFIQCKLSKKTAQRGDDDRPPLRRCRTRALAGIVDAVAHEDDVVGAAIEIVTSAGRQAGPTLATIKARNVTRSLAALRDTETPVD